MFDDDENEWYDADFSQQLNSFNNMYERNEYTYIDSEELEFILDHLTLMGQNKKAKWAAVRALEHFPYNSAIRIKLAEIYNLEGKPKQALRELSFIEELEPHNVDLLLAMANCYKQLNKNKLAITYLRKGFDFAPEEDKADIVIELAMEYENMKDYSSAIQVLEKINSTAFMRDLIVFELGHCYEKIGQIEKAIKTYLDYIDNDPYSHISWYNLGNTYAKNNMLDKAIWAYEYAILVEDTFIPAHYNLANTYFDNNQIEKSLESYKRCIELDDKDPMVFCAIGECYEELGEFEKAYEMYSASTNLLPQFADAWLGKGIISDILGFHKRAIKQLKIALNLDRTRVETWKSIGIAFENDEQYDLAINAYRETLLLEPNEEETIINLISLIYLLKGNEIFEYMEDSPELFKNDVAKLGLIYCHWLAGNQSQAMLLFHEVIDENINLAEEFFHYFPIFNEIPYFCELLQNQRHTDDINNEEF